MVSRGLVALMIACLCASIWPAHLAHARGLAVPISGLSAATSSPTVLGRTTYYTATQSTGDNITYAWNFGDGGLGAGATTTHVYAQTGTFTTILTATNGSGSQSVSRSVVVTNQRPLANAGFDQTRQVTGTVTLNASLSTDPDAHYPLEYLWRQTGGPPVALDYNNVVPPTFPALSAPATVTFSLIVTDARGLGSVAPDLMTVRFRDIEINGLSAVNNSPNIVGITTLFTGSVVAGTNVAYAWNFGDGMTGTGALPSHVYASTGFYDAVLTATNSEGSVTATTRISITNGTPYAFAGADQTVYVNSLATLNGSASYDPDGHNPLTYSWKQTAGATRPLTNPNSAIASFSTPALPTVLTFTLTVTDSRGLVTIGPDDIVINVADVPITNVIGRSSSPTVLGERTYFTASIGSGTNTLFNWDFGNGAGGQGTTISTTYNAIGVYTVTLNAYNGTNIVRINFPVTVTNAMPIPNAGTDQSVPVGSTVTLNGAASYDPDNHKPLQYRWTQTSGTPVVLANASLSSTTFLAPITPALLGFSLNVTDARGLRNASPDVILIFVGDLPITGLAVASDAPKTIGTAVAMTGSVTGGTNVRYGWTFGDGTGGSGITTTHLYTAPGVYTVTLTADNATNSMTATMSVTVWPIPIARLSAATHAVRESDSGVAVTVELDRVSTNPITVTIAPAQETAGSPADYAGQNAQRVIPAGQISTTMTVPLTNDALHEATETFSITLVSAQNAQLGIPDAAKVTITDDDPPPAISFESGYYTATEHAGAATMYVLLSAPSALPTTVSYAVPAGPASEASSGVLRFDPGQVRLEIPITVLDDALIESDTEVFATLSAPGNGALGAISVARLTLLDDESPPIVRFQTTQGTVTTGKRVTVTVQLDRASTLLATVLVQHNGDTQALTFPPGVLTAAFYFTAPATPNATVTLNLVAPLSAPANALLSADAATATYRVVAAGFKVHLPLMNRR